MPQSRKSQVCLAATPYYHCISRCVRRAFLCGKDALTGKSYEHRRDWVEKKLLALTSIFAIDVCAYAVMHNHTHIVLHVDVPKASSWSTKDILVRWHRLFSGTLLTQAYLQGASLNEQELKTVKQTAIIYQQRLVNISWFMRVLNEGIARAANKEDECTGRFWEGRFKSQALLDEGALIACMAYVDLNPVRAGITKQPKSSDYTSIKHRIHCALNNTQPASLKPFIQDKQDTIDKPLPFNVEDYIELVNVTASSISQNPQLIHSETSRPQLLEKLTISAENWLIMTAQFSRLFHGAVGSAHALSNFHDRLHHKRRRQINLCQRLLG